MTLLTVQNVGKSFGGVRANHDISFALKSGELLALIGPNGAGKSTLFNIINGQTNADTGSVRFEGTELSGLQPRQIWRLGVGRTFQVAFPFGSMTAIENVQVALMSRDRKIFNFWRWGRNYCRDEALGLLQRVALTDQAEKPCNYMAYGDVKRLELAVALANKPRLLLMDEPTAGMAPQERNELMALTKRLVLEDGLSVLFTEHSMDVVFAYSDRIVVLARGELIAEGSPAEVRANAKVQEVYFGTGNTFETEGQAS
ncbi:MAG: ABC transporter ATP-binding protein [Rhizobiaceae bacterium]|nr:ABC transporter ATP-binding protein [Rhizobiaceae bacterium]